MGDDARRTGGDSTDRRGRHRDDPPRKNPPQAPTVGDPAHQRVGRAQAGGGESARSASPPNSDGRWGNRIRRLPCSASPASAPRSCSISPPTQGLDPGETAQGGGGDPSTGDDDGTETGVLVSLLSGATLTMAHPDRTRLQVFIPTATATALGIAAESLGLSKTQTVETILGQYLTRQGMLTTNTAAWPKPKPASIRPTADHAAHPPGRVAAVPARQHFRRHPLGYRQWDSHRTAGRQGLPSAEKMDATSKPGQRTNPGEDGRRHQSPPSTKRSQLERSGTHLHPRRLRRGLQRLQKAPRSPRGQHTHWDGPKLGDSAALYETQPF